MNIVNYFGIYGLGAYQVGTRLKSDVDVEDYISGGISGLVTPVEKVDKGSVESVGQYPKWHSRDKGLGNLIDEYC